MEWLGMTMAMHSYAAEPVGRERMLGVLALASVGLAWGMNRLLSLWAVSEPWWLDAPSVLGFFGMGRWLFDRYLWKIRLRWPVKLVIASGFNGIWTGEIRSSFDNFSQPHRATVTIDQTWTSIRVVLETERSRSVSLSASVLCDQDSESVLLYSYLNEPKPGAPNTMQIHRGAATLRLRNGYLEGEYFTGRGREEFGRVRFEREARHP